MNEASAANGHAPAGFVGAEPQARLLEAEEVARYLGMRIDWVYREVRAGRLPHIRLGRAVRFRRESINAWLAAQEQQPSTRRRTG
jgi:excisionase family DNA binding protein